MRENKSHLEDSWKELDVRPESVPHLLHWDLAYLWVLERSPEMRPDSWEERVSAWEKLFQLLLAGRLRVESRPIPEPLARLAGAYGVHEVRLLYLDDVADPVGVLSPVVLVRPLPGEVPAALRAARLGPAELAAAAHCLEIARKRLEELVRPGLENPIDRPLQSQLKRILDRLDWGQPHPVRLQYLDVELLRAVNFATRGVEVVADRLAIPYALESEGARVFVPRCSACHQLMTHEDDPSKVREISDDAVELECPGGHRELLDLKRLFVWRRSLGDRTEYVYWTDRSSAFPSTEPAGMDWPPVPDEIDGQLRFHWDPGFLSGERNRVCLRLRPPTGTRFRRASVTEEALYGKLLVPGDPRRHTGLPVRWEWRDAWLGCGKTLLDSETVHYRRVSLRGLPFDFDWPYTFLALRVEAELFPGIYPMSMHPHWKPYRVVALDQQRRDWVVRVESGKGPVPFVQETEGWPEWVAVETPDGACGTSWRLERPPATRTEDSSPPVNLGIDFGTAATVVYFSTSSSIESTTNNAVHLGGIRDLMYWLSPDPAPPGHTSEWFFPRPPQEGQDPCLIPSALWLPPTGAGFIRWAEKPPGNWRSSHGFKWDEGLENRRTHRESFLTELLFFVLPFILDRLGNRAARPPLNVGFAYPLAFSFEQRLDYAAVLREVKNWLRSKGGFDRAHVFSLNESLAAVRALGRPEVGEPFLIADMGGHTLDVSLFSFPDEFHQIGSVNFGAEIFLNRAVKTAGDSQQQAEDYWRLRDAIFSGRLSHYGGNKRMTETLDRFQVMALEYLRTMLAAHFEKREHAAPIKLILIGNGWRLRDLTAGKGSPESNFRDYFQRMLKLFAMPGVQLEFSSVEGVPWSKHWVAIGALRNAAAAERDELADREPYPDKLPSGRDLTIAGKRIPWHELVGEGVDGQIDEARLEKSQCSCDFESGPDPAPGWATRLEGAVPPEGRYPREEEMREWLFEAVDNARLRKGPLQLILEKHWVRAL